VKRVRIEVVGPEEDYPSYTCYLWLLETKDLIEDDFDVKVDVRWEKGIEKLSLYNYFPVLLVEGKKAFVGLPSEAGFLYEIIRGFLIRELGLSPK